jgi:serine/threonine protein kinase
MGEVHRDLTPHNGMPSSFPPDLYLVLFTKGFWKIADFGLTSTGTSKKLVTTSAARGKDSYRAPELLRDSEAGYNNKSDMWSFGCIAFELLTGRKAFSNDFEVWQYGAAKRSPKMYFKGLDDLAKYYLAGLLEVDLEKRPSARALLKEKFLTETPSADSVGAVRAQKRRRTSLTVSIATSTEPSSRLKASMDWAISNGQRDLILALIEVGLRPVCSLEVIYDVLDAFRADWNASSHIRLGKFMNLYEAVGFISKTDSEMVGLADDSIDDGKSREPVLPQKPDSGPYRHPATGM